MVKISLNDKVTKLKEKSKAKNTQDKYQGDWLKFIDYCNDKYKCSPLDVDDMDSAYALTANYMDWLHEDPEAKILKGTSNIPGREKVNNNPSTPQLHIKHRRYKEFLHQLLINTE